MAKLVLDKNSTALEVPKLNSEDWLYEYYLDNFLKTQIPMVHFLILKGWGLGNLYFIFLK